MKKLIYVFFLLFLFFGLVKVNGFGNQRIRFKPTDTLIGNKTYTWVLYDLNKKPVQIGENYENQIKNGHWLFFDQYDNLLLDTYFKNNIQIGYSIEYTHFSPYPQASIKFEGYRNNENCVGLWIGSVQISRNKWLKTCSELYDSSEKKLVRTNFYPDGKLIFEIYYGYAGKEVWFKAWDKKGKLIKDDDIPFPMTEL